MNDPNRNAERIRTLEKADKWTLYEVEVIMKTLLVQTALHKELSERVTLLEGRRRRPWWKKLLGVR